MKLCFEIELQSDYHVASGHGRGALIDSALFRDSDGIPVLRGTTIAGLLRDAMRDLLGHPSLSWVKPCPDSQGTSPGEVKENRFCKTDPCTICRIFGSPASAKEWSVGSARPATEPKMREVPVADGAAAQVANRSSTDIRRRRTIPGRLFNRENGASRLRFRFEVTGPGGERGQRDGALIVAAARMVRHLGQSRRRGSGSCTVRLTEEGETQPELLEQMLGKFRDCWLQGKQDTPLPSRRSNSDWSASLDNSSDDNGPRRFQLLLATREPVLVGAARQSGNEIAGSEFIPGTTLLGALAALAAGRWNLDDVDSELYSAFVNVFRRGGVRFPILYPATAAGDSAFVTVPTPRDLFICRRSPAFTPEGKFVRGEIHPCVQATRESEFPIQCPKCDKDENGPLDPVEGLLKPGDFGRTETRMREEMHVHIDPKTKTAAEGDLFSYWAIDAGQHFYGELQFANDQALQQFQQLTGLDLATQPAATSLRLGRASRRGYGLVDCHLEEFPFGDNPHSKPSRRIARPAAERLTSLDDRVSLLFLTDVILTDNYGRYVQSIDAQWIRETCFGDMEVDIGDVNQFVATANVGGFNAHLGLPRQRELAVAAGSAVGFKITASGNTTLADIVERIGVLESNGVGLRRNEGFGCIAFNHPVYTLDNVNGARCDLADDLQLSEQPPAGADDMQSVMEFIRRWSNRLNKELGSTDFSDKRWGGMGQWILAAEPQDLDALLEHLERLRNGNSENGSADNRPGPGDPTFVFEFDPTLLRETNYFADKDKGLTPLKKLHDVLKDLKRSTDSGERTEQRAAGLRMVGGYLISSVKSAAKGKD